MTPQSRKKLLDRVVKAAEAALAARHYVTSIDVLVGLGWLDGARVERWRRGQIPYLERVVEANLPRSSEAMKLFRSWASERGLSPSQTVYASRKPNSRVLRFSASGHPAIEALYRTHWIAPELSEKKRERLVEKASRAPDVVVIQPLNQDWHCHRCGGTGGFLMMEEPGPVCLRCTGLGDLAFLPAGKALLTRRVKAQSTRHAVVIRFSRSRDRYERIGLLVEPQALSDTQRALAPP